MEHTKWLGEWLVGESESQWPGEWFLGESELDPGQTGFDGTVWCKPATAEDEPYLIAEHIEDKRVAQIIATAPFLLQELGNIVTADWRTWNEDCRTPEDFVAWAKARARAAIAKATGKE